MISEGGKSDNEGGMKDYMKKSLKCQKLEEDNK